MLPADNVAAARHEAELYASFPEVKQYYDPRRRVGRAVAQVLGGEGKVAWDMYLFYPAGVIWEERAPRPLDWVHQLGDDDWAGAGHFHWGERLAPALAAAMRRLLGSKAER